MKKASKVKQVSCTYGSIQFVAASRMKERVGRSLETSLIHGYEINRSGYIYIYVYMNHACKDYAKYLECRFLISSAKIVGSLVSFVL